MRIATWNVNSLRTRLEQVVGWLETHQPDVLCLQETKVADELFPHDPLNAVGYRTAISGQKAYNGVALISRQPLDDLCIGFDGLLEEDEEAVALSEQKRVISGRLGPFAHPQCLRSQRDIRPAARATATSWPGWTASAAMWPTQLEQGEPLCMVGGLQHCP